MLGASDACAEEQVDDLQRGEVEASGFLPALRLAGRQFVANPAGGRFVRVWPALLLPDLDVEAAGLVAPEGLRNALGHEAKPPELCTEIPGVCLRSS